VHFEVITMRFKPWTVVLGALLLLASAAAPVVAHEVPPAVVPAPEANVAPSAEPDMDPVLRAILIAMAARMLTEAARSPDPMGTLGDSLERALSSVLRSPASARMLEDLMGRALKDVPPELRAPLALFAGSMLDSMRRERLDNRRQRAPY